VGSIINRESGRSVTSRTEAARDLRGRQQWPRRSLSGRSRT